MDKIEIIVNGMEFQEIPNPEFRLYVEKDEDPFPFMMSYLSDSGFMYPYRTYKALNFNGKFYGPVIKK